MKAKAQCPASCGEWLQGYIGEGEKLISCPINMFSVARVEEARTPKRDKTKQKALMGIYRTLEYFGESSKIGDQLELSIASEIPIAKGMASSTADIGAAAAATAKLLGKNLEEDQLTKICVEIEPTDSILYKNLTLLDHLKGIRVETFDWTPQVDILILEAYDHLDTQEFRKTDHKKLLMESKSQMEQAIQIFRQALQARDLKLLGQAATISAMANQKLLPKQNLEEIIETSNKLGCYGVNVAHSGTIVGIIFDKSLIPSGEIIRRLKNEGLLRNYYKTYAVKTIEGGIRNLEGENIK